MYTGLFGQDENQNIIQTRRKPVAHNFVPGGGNLQNYMSGLSGMQGWQRNPHHWAGVFDNFSKDMYDRSPLFGWLFDNLPVSDIRVSGPGVPSFGGVPGMNIGETMTGYRDRVRQGLIPYLDEQEIQG